MNRKAQAMIVDALFFLMLCGMSAAVLAWASSVYGNQALDAYKYLYLIDLETSTLQTVTESSYTYQNNEMYWIDQLGRYIDGQFNETDDRFKLLLDQWNRTCSTAGMPLLIYVYPETVSQGKTSVCSSKVCADEDHPLVLTCPIGNETQRSSALESVLTYMCKDGTSGYVDLGARTKNPKYKHLLFLNTNSGVLSSKCQNPKVEPPYYSSTKFAKLCHDRICDMYAKIYY